ncbi:oxidoreductase [Penicillium odoratum]|uniref:oxidoreductase n=1 Tax=Penicillium odoratum TaxID=1167516 RepID=UPI002547AC16|nr:oxidoreductase [Penicillium odoratum]KAJ5769566.1 oxidoreductase [Penicillium odoratum]
MSTGNANIIVPGSTHAFDFVVVGAKSSQEGQQEMWWLVDWPRIRKFRDPEKIAEITTPARAFETRNGPQDWKYKSTLIDRPDYTRVEKPNTRGKVLGGSSSLNYYAWLRGSKTTFDDWSDYAPGWNWNSLKDYFDKSVTYHDDAKIYTHVRNIGLGGPLHVEHAELVPELRPFRDALLKAWRSKGLQVNDRIYDGTQNGITRCVNTIYKGIRSSSWSFLVGKPNVHVLPGSHCKRLIINADKVTGVEVRDPNGKDITVQASKEVIVACGVYESPKLLMLSGIGPENELSQFGIKAISSSPHVGLNLLDHPILPHVFRLKDGMGLDDHLLRAGPQKEGAITAYNRDHSGPLGSGLLELVGFPRIDDRLAGVKEYIQAKKENKGVDPFGPGGQPHFQIDFVPMFSDAFQWHFPVPPEGSWLTVIVDLLRPISKPGWVKLRSKDPLDDPYINLNYFNDHLDVIVLREGIRAVDDILMTGESFKEIIGEDYPWPMPRNSNEAMDKLILERSQTGFHPCGTCRLSKNIEQGVVDGALKVHGFKNLRVIDASVFPVIPDCRIQNAVYMVGEKGADLIKADHKDLY